MRMDGFKLVAVLMTLLLAVSAAEAKPKEGKGGPDAAALEKAVEKEAEAAEKAAEMKAKAAEEEADQKMSKEKAKLKGLEKQKVKKAEQMQKELDKGSEKGKAMREQHRRKWWKFWGGEDKPEETTAE